MVDPEVETVAPVWTTVTVYPVIGVPPVLPGAVQVTVALASPAIAETPVGAPGTSAGTIATDATEAVLVPAAFVAVTVNV